MKKYLIIVLLVGVCFGQTNFLDLVDEPNYEYSGFSKIKLININVFGFESIRGFSNERIKRIVENLCYQILPDGLIYDENKYGQYINKMKIENTDIDYLMDLVGRKYGFKIIVDLRAYEHKNNSGKYYGSIDVAFSTNAEMKYINYQPSDSYIKKKFPNADGDFYSSMREPKPHTYFNAELSSEGMHFIFNDANAIEENLREVARDVIENINIMIKRYP